jgi:hypothetical protein
MVSRVRTLMNLLAITALCLPQLVYPGNFKKTIRAEKAGDATARVLWQPPLDIASRNLLYGPGGREHQPRGQFKFIEEDLSGTKPKFKIEDEQGVRWKVKLGKEAQPETSATRLLWAVGYLTDEDYYLHELRVQGMKKLKRGQNLVAVDGTIQGARLERHLTGEKRIGHWSWFKNPFVGTKELNGLKVMMALINNTDLKKENNSIYDEEGLEHRYVVSDLGSSFGKTGNFFDHSVGNLNDYLASKFIKRVKSQEVDFVMDHRPPFILVFALPYYVSQTRMQQIVRHIPRKDTRWIGRLLSQLSEHQIEDAFRAGGFTSQQVDHYARKVQERIAELNQL